MFEASAYQTVVILTVASKLFFCTDMGTRRVPDPWVQGRIPEQDDVSQILFRAGVRSCREGWEVAILPCSQPVDLVRISIVF